jgi:lipopolysaccharide/colanic/teichoic acid biosynthesis glycosyltransferase/nucleoside-diphosphate-sugar epimerase
MHRRSAAPTADISAGEAILPLRNTGPGEIYARGGKHVFDFALSLIGLIFLSPVLLVIACAVKARSRGPAFFRQTRVGRLGEPFQIVKFRTMTLDAESRGAGITARCDPRITRLGRFLREYKLDELPQLWNVVRGEMSLVGPRPELPLYVERYSDWHRAVLAVRPGITGLDAIAYRDEELLLAAAVEPASCYEQAILPDKLALSLKYLRRISLLGDLKIIFASVRSLFRLSHSVATLPDWNSGDHLADLLGREPVEIDLKSARASIEGRSILVTGAAGSIGSELCRQIISLNPAKLVCLDRDRAGIDRLRAALDRGPSLARVSFVVADVGDQRAVGDCLAANGIDFIFHAAAHKHLPALESNVVEAVRNNVFALEVLLEAADEASCRGFVLISSDKAVNPSSVMGATKRIGELMLAARPQRRMRCVAVRFGNVLGSSGSVVPILAEQLRSGAPLTITDPESKRFFMTGGEAASLALEAFAVGRHGEILVLEMGAPVEIVDLAKKMARMLRREESRVDIRYIGLRSGEKLEEELFYAHETVTRSASSRICRAQGECTSWDKLCQGLQQLRESVNSKDPASIREALREIVPEYASPAFEDREREKCRIGLGGFK